MFRKIIKKLFSSILFHIIYFLFLLVVFFVWSRLISALNIPMSANWVFITTLLLTLLIELLAVYSIRIENTELKEKFLTQYHKLKYIPFLPDFLNTAKSSDNIIHAIIHNLLLLPFVLLIAIESEAAIGWIIFGTAIIFLTGFILFTVINSILWHTIHKRWHRNKEPKNWGKAWNAILNRLKGK